MPEPVRPERPALVEPTKPEDPDLGHAEKTGKYASVAGYIMSVGVGAFGQIMFFADMVRDKLPPPYNWVVGFAGAAFAETAMIGSGSYSLIKRRNEGKWRLLLAVACFVCACAVAMQAAHWYPKGPGVVLIFCFASFIGFMVHMVIEHSKLRDSEDRKKKYEQELAAYNAEVQKRYEQDLAEYQAEINRQRRLAEQAAAKANAPEPRPAAAAQPAKQAEGTKASKEVAVPLGVQQKLTTPKELKQGLLEAGYSLPRSSSSIENWCAAIRDELAKQSS
ncbi:hypothetical protein D5S17_23465 [Pseudonocardiaceae bacterium YIM PH 21723]|nr:hypothetical protein D5S17_23465 [Pseudonocardiaceae bacterium YIM PH 21723]